MSEQVLDDEAEERSAIETSVAAGLAELSAVEVPPSEVDVRSPFEPEDVQFGGGAWIEFVVRVQDWLRLIQPIDSQDSPVVAVARLFEGMGLTDLHAAFVADGDRVVLTDAGLDLLGDRVDRAVDLKDKFLEASEAGSLAAATAAWIEDWEGTVEETISGPILAKSGIWPIADFASRAKSGRLELSPSYQRGDVWPNKDAQLLIESILRGIPLPSVIILRPSRNGDAPYEVVDGKQRLTAILRFMGAHPKALATVHQKSVEFPEHELESLFANDYPRFRRAWKNATGESLSSTKEREYYFPFKLSSTSEALVGDLGPLRGGYFHSIKDQMVVVGGERMRVHEVFELATDYKIPVIEYTEATPRQIHEVFSLYNKQGKHLNAEEIRNAVYHELELMRALSVAAGDNSDLEGATPFLQSDSDSVGRIAANLNEYRFGDARYRRTKVLSWFISLLLADDPGDDGRLRLLSTSQQINNLLDQVQSSTTDPLRTPVAIRSLLKVASGAMEAHSASDAWADAFKDGDRGVRWQELQLVASLLGVAMATAVLGGDIEDRLIEHEAELKLASATAEWKRPQKTQTGKQWEYIAGVAVAIVGRLDVSLDDVDRALRERYGRSGVPTLLACRDARIN